MNVVKRIIFEIIFVVLLCILMPWHIIWGCILMVYECIKVYPSEIYELSRRIVYNSDEEES